LIRGQFRRAVEALCSARRIVISSHVNPDGDALGCTLALTHALKKLGKDVVPLLSDGVPDIYSWMPGANLVQRSTDRRDFDLAIVCDAGGIIRVGRSIVPVIESAPVLLDIDHHVADGPFGDIRILDARAAATAELVWILLKRLSAATGVSLVDSEIARCLQAGLITDTGSFRFPNATPFSFELAATLQRLGAEPAPINELVFETRTYASIKLLGRALDSLRVTPDGMVAWAHVTRADFEEFQALDAETEGIVNHVRAVKGVRVGLLFREVPDGLVRISLRAREGADVNRIANVFGGGGHRLAAGCSLPPPLADAEQSVIAETLRQLKAA
jgi:phosphoesterase RecJ-like protein